MVNKKKKSSKFKKEKKLEKERIPVTILSGFLGSGKTTLLRYILNSHEHKKKVAVIVNDMADLNIDAAVVGGDSGAIVQAKKEVISLSNGCICCTLRGDLIREIDRIRKLGNHDYILVESTGIAEPQQVAESFCADPNTQALAEDPSQMLWNVARLDTCVTVLDAREFPRLVKSVERFKDRFTDGMEDHDPDGEGEKSIANLLIQQVEFANVILVNKIDLVSNAERDDVLKVVKTLNPGAKVITTEYGVVDLKHILNSKTFSMEEAKLSPGWLQSLKEPLKTESDEYGISSFVYQARKPFHPSRLSAWIRSIVHFAEDWNEGNIQDDAKRLATMETEFGQILRSKGFCWVAGRDSIQTSWALSGRLLQLFPLAEWCANKPEKNWNTNSPEELAEMRKNFEGEYGDRRQAIVFIGINLKKDVITSSLNECLLTDDEMKSHSLTATFRYRDNLPAWRHTVHVPGINFCPILMQGQTHKFHIVAEALALCVSNLSLHYPQEVADHDAFGTISVKVWLDKGEGEERDARVLATLRPGIIEQHSLTHKITEVGRTYTMRMEVNARTNKRTGSGKTVSRDWLENAGIQVHVAGLTYVDESITY